MDQDRLKQTMNKVSGYWSPGNTSPSKFSSMVLNRKRMKMISELLEESWDIDTGTRTRYRPSAGCAAKVSHLESVTQLPTSRQHECWCHVFLVDFVTYDILRIVLFRPPARFHRSHIEQIFVFDPGEARRGDSTHVDKWTCV